MDSNSISSSPVTAVTENNSSSRECALSPIAASPRATEDDVALSVTAGLAREAALLFQAEKFVDCVNLLKMLLQKKENDPKILHNIAIAESFQDGCSDPKKLLESLSNVKKRCEDLSQASEEQSESVGNISKAQVGSKGNYNLALPFSSSSSLPVYGDGHDTSVTMFNMAVIWFHLHEYAKALSILDLLYQNIEPIDEGTALRICLLLLDVALVSNNVSKAADVISYLEKAFCINSLNQVDNGSSSHQPTVLSKPSLASISDAAVAANSDSAPTESVLESSLSRTLSDEGLEDESLLSSLGIGGDSMSRPSNLHSATDPLKTQIEDSVSTMDLRLRLHLYKVSFLLLTRNLKAAKREVKMAMNIRGKDHTLALYLKSQLEYARGNHRKAIKLLMASSNETEVGVSSIFYNNLGCIYYHLGKYHTSTVLFSKALSHSVALRKEKPVKLAILSQDKSLQIMYNCGLTYLACGKPLSAARYFHKASLIFYNRPLLWLRIAECCLMASEKGLPKSSHSMPSDGSDVKVHVIGKGNWRQLALADGVSRTGKLDFVGKGGFSFSKDGEPILSFSLARQCLLNALYLLESSDTKDSKSALVSSSTGGSESGESLTSQGTNYKSDVCNDPNASNTDGSSSQVNANGEVKEQKFGAGQNSSLLNSLHDYEVIHRKENQMTKQAVLADMAYCELEMGNPSKALTVARSLLKLSECSRIYLFLGNMYAAEALCLLNRPKEAADHLLAYVAGGNNVEVPYSQEDFEKWRVEKLVDSEETNVGSVPSNGSLPEESQGSIFLKPEEARGIIYANQAATSAMLGELERAQQFVVQASSVLPNNPQVILTSVYLDLLHGRTEDAVAKLKQGNRVRFLPGSLRLDGTS